MKEGENGMKTLIRVEDVVWDLDDADFEELDEDFPEDAFEFYADLGPDELDEESVERAVENYIDSEYGLCHRGLSWTAWRDGRRVL